MHLGIPIIRNLIVFNDGTEAVGPGEVELSFLPAFAKSLRLPFDVISAQSSVSWKCPALAVHADFLANASEAQDAVVRAVIRGAPLELAAECRPTLCEQSQSIRLLAFNEWPGLGELPELLAAFVTPNQSSISELLYGASEWLRQTHAEGTIDGYQSGDPRRALRLAEAIFNSVLQRQITYVSPPASYETTGQKVRLVEQVWLGRQGACLDLTLLFASALEAAGLHPLVCVEKGHAFVGCWLRQDRLFDLSFEDDVQVLRKGVDGLNLCVFEATLACQDSATFSAAVSAGRERLENEADFRWALDVARARSKRVRPLPVKVQDGRIFIAPEPKPLAGVASPKMPDLEDMVEAFDDRAVAVLSLAAIKAEDIGTPYIGSIASLCDDLLLGRPDWQRWTLLQTSIKRAGECGLSEFAAALSEGRIVRGTALDDFDRAYAWATLQVILDREPTLLNFFGDEHEQAIERFRQLDTKLTDINSRYVVAKVAASRPSGLNDSKVFGEIAILRSEIEKKTNWKAVRALLASIPNLLPKLKPCVLMSPLSVAQYLDVAHPPFDVVIFDEASQIPVCDAIGALARCKQTIVAGDPKQLPPTSFFQKVDTGDYAEEEDETGQPIPRDQESILDECLSAQIPEHHLAWHYRSRREALIAFSNLHYYENRLLTFPAPEAKEEGVFFHHVGAGFYDRGASRTNREEAVEVIKAVKAHLLDPNKDGQSLAVITFNTEQMTLIENLLDNERLKDVSFDEAINARTASHLEEPFKVRNLESIQGDERDVIFFSITYGPDSSGYVSHNFGPLNKPGGERRLNVAITRAKHAVHLFSSLRSHHIDLKRTGARGVRDLKNYLQYAEEGVAALARVSTIAAEEHNYDSAFERHVAEALRGKGWEVLTQIGCSAYRIDLGVLHPEQRGRFLAGVECDGATYHRAATARDRDRLRQRFLEGLGWRMVRTWSTDWFRDPAKEAERLHALLKEFKEKGSEESAPPGSPPVSFTTERDPVLSHSIKAVPAPVMATAVHAHMRYEAAVLSPMHLDKDRFTEPAMRPVISVQIEKVMLLEAPISVGVLTTRIREAWGFGRAGAKIEQVILAAVPRNVIKRGEFLWRSDQSPSDFTQFRSDSTESETRRDLDDIAPEEQAAAMAWLVERFSRVPESDLLRETASIFGRKAFTESAKVALAPGLQSLLDKGFMRGDDGDIFKT
ncbi:MAG: DUF3320 domain-containing protein [Verrucomicrobia bacterium]|nr:DUF3320 domain-containing protein [Verrucomicrobiota bacterium]